MEKIDNYLHDYAFLIIIGFIIIVFVVIIIAFIKEGNRRKKLKETTLPRRFRYLDTFYYIDSDGEDTEVVAYNLIQETVNNKIYLMANSQFEYCNFISGQDARLVIGKKGFIHKMPKVDFNREGNLWIEKEEYDGIRIEDGIITFNIKNAFINSNLKLVYDKKNHPEIKGYYLELFNINPEYDSSILNEATFITGVAEFDNYGEL